jgi:hypothetical protein
MPVNFWGYSSYTKQETSRERDKRNLSNARKNSKRKKVR